MKSPASAIWFWYVLGFYIACWIYLNFHIQTLWICPVCSFRKQIWCPKLLWVRYLNTSALRSQLNKGQELFTGHLLPVNHPKKNFITRGPESFHRIGDMPWWHTYELKKIHKGMILFHMLEGWSWQFELLETFENLFLYSWWLPDICNLSQSAQAAIIKLH